MFSSSNTSERFDVHRALTARIVEAIEAGAGAFAMPWHTSGPGVGRPTNAFSGVGYRGVNVVALWAEAMLSGYASGAWASYRQWAKLGAQVRRGEHGTTIVFYKPREQREDEVEGDDGGAQLIARASRVFNADQVAALLNVEAGTIKYLHRTQQLPGVLVGKHLRWKPETVQKYVEELES